MWHIACNTAPFGFHIELQFFIIHLRFRKRKVHVQTGYECALCAWLVALGFGRSSGNLQTTHYNVYAHCNVHGFCILSWLHVHNVLLGAGGRPTTGPWCIRMLKHFFACCRVMLYLRSNPSGCICVINCMLHCFIWCLHNAVNLVVHVWMRYVFWLHRISFMCVVTGWSSWA